MEHPKAPGLKGGVHTPSHKSEKDIHEKGNKELRNIPPSVHCSLSGHHTAGLDLVLADLLVDGGWEALLLPASPWFSPERHCEYG
jgi:hypothetical protein